MRKYIQQRIEELTAERTNKPTMRKTYTLTMVIIELESLLAKFPAEENKPTEKEKQLEASLYNLILAVGKSPDTVLYEEVEGSEYHIAVKLLESRGIEF